LAATALVVFRCAASLIAPQQFGRISAGRHSTPSPIGCGIVCQWLCQCLFSGQHGRACGILSTTARLTNRWNPDLWLNSSQNTHETFATTPIAVPCHSVLRASFPYFVLGASNAAPATPRIGKSRPRGPTPVKTAKSGFGPCSAPRCFVLHTRYFNHNPGTSKIGKSRPRGPTHRGLYPSTQANPQIPNPDVSL
jgi:hypothetical protein